mmetsp:Transcript_17107/g.51729  ORF Transcript_17107/g.51729 Transcript_17107/m.51729 type:complete len:220 (+) Transcript_17107:633-1292(+)
MPCQSPFIQILMRVPSGSEPSVQVGWRLGTSSRTASQTTALTTGILVSIAQGRYVGTWRSRRHKVGLAFKVQKAHLASLVIVRPTKILAGRTLVRTATDSAGRTEGSAPTTDSPHSMMLKPCREVNSSPRTLSKPLFCRAGLAPSKAAAPAPLTSRASCRRGPRHNQRVQRSPPPSPLRNSHLAPHSMPLSSPKGDLLILGQRALAMPHSSQRSTPKLL